MVSSSRRQGTLKRSSIWALPMRMVRRGALPCQCIMWFNLAAGQGTERAVRAGELIAKDLTPAQIAQAQELARDWKPTKQPITLAEKTAAFYRATFLAAPQPGSQTSQSRGLQRSWHVGNEM